VWVWVTVVGLLLEVGVIVVLGRSATRGSEQDLPAAPAGPAVGPGGTAVSPAGHRAAPAARR
jgi:hypothetical protein